MDNVVVVYISRLVVVLVSEDRDQLYELGSSE
jgi:hypothetical protein